jgi:transposase
MESFKNLIDQNKYRTLNELERISGRYSTTTIWQGIRKLGYSYKKTSYHPKRDEVAREEFIKK